MNSCATRWSSAFRNLIEFQLPSLRKHVERADVGENNAIMDNDSLLHEISTKSAKAVQDEWARRVADGVSHAFEYILRFTFPTINGTIFGKVQNLWEYPKEALCFPERKIMITLYFSM